MTVPNIFANQVGPIPLSELDTNFSFVETEISAIRSQLTQFNVVAYGAVGDGSTDNTAAIAAAYAAIPSTGGVLFFPQGIFNYTNLSFTNSKPLVILGTGQFSTILQCTTTSSDGITINGPSQFSCLNIGLTSAQSRTASTYLLHVLSCTRPIVSNCYVNTVTGGLLMFETCNFVQLSQIQGDTGDGTCLRVKAAGGNYSNVYLRGAATQSRPVLWITGVTTSLKMGTCAFAGGGPHSKWNVSGITSTGANFTVTTTATHDFQAGDYLVLRGMTPSAYNNMWRIASVGATTIVVTSTANPGTSTVQGTAESVSACGYVSNEDGAVNESSITNTLFEALQPNTYGTAGLYFDGRRGIALGKLAISGWTLGAGNYYDYGATGLLISGDKANAGLDPTVSGISVGDATYSSNNRGLLIDQATGINVAVGQMHGVTTLSADDIGHGYNQGILIYAGPSAPFTQGITITGVNAGMPRNWAAASTLPFNAGIMLDSPGIQDLVVTGCNLFGTTLPVQEFNTPLASTSRWKFKGNVLNFGTYPPNNTNVVPSVASGASTNIYPYYEAQKITGTTNISNINPVRIGFEVDLLFASALTLLTGGNLAITANYNVLAGQLVRLVCDGTSWYLK